MFSRTRHSRSRSWHAAVSRMAVAVLTCTRGNMVGLLGEVMGMSASHAAADRRQAVQEGKHTGSPLIKGKSSTTEALETCLAVFFQPRSGTGSGSGAHIPSAAMSVVMT